MESSIALVVRDGGRGCFQNEWELLRLTHSLTHSHPYSTRRVPSSVRFQNTSHVSSPCTPLKDCDVTYCDIPCRLQGCHKIHGCLMTLYLLATSETELVRVLPRWMELEASPPAHRSYRNTILLIYPFITRSPKRSFTFRFSDWCLVLSPPCLLHAWPIPASSISSLWA
jgi:hypothetical protein